MLPQVPVQSTRNSPGVVSTDMNPYKQTVSTRHPLTRQSVCKLTLCTVDNGQFLQSPKCSQVASVASNLDNSVPVDSCEGEKGLTQSSRSSVVCCSQVPPVSHKKPVKSSKLGTEPSAGSRKSERPRKLTERYQDHYIETAKNHWASLSQTKAERSCNIATTRQRVQGPVEASMEVERTKSANQAVSQGQMEKLTMELSLPVTQGDMSMKNDAVDKLQARLDRLIVSLEKAPYRQVRQVRPFFVSPP